MKLAINLISRERPELLVQTVKTILGNMKVPSTVLMVSLDDDDEASINAITEFAPGLVISVEPREDGLGDKWNRALKVVPDADVYMPACDDGPIVTPGFDRRILDAAKLFPDGIGCVYNHLENASFPGITAVTKNLADKMGYIWPGYWPYWFCDHWLVDIVALIDRASFADVKIDCSTNRPPTMGMREPAFWANFYDAGYLARRKLAFDIINGKDFKEPDWRKEYLLRRYPLIEWRSRWINDQVRMGVAPQFDTVRLPPPDERYIRIKAKAIKRMMDWLPELETEGRAA